LKHSGQCDRQQQKDFLSAVTKSKKGKAHSSPHTRNHTTGNKRGFRRPYTQRPVHHQACMTGPPEQPRRTAKGLAGRALVGGDNRQCQCACASSPWPVLPMRGRGSRLERSAHKGTPPCAPYVGHSVFFSAAPCASSAHRCSSLLFPISAFRGHSALPELGADLTRAERQGHKSKNKPRNGRSPAGHPRETQPELRLWILHKRFGTRWRGQKWKIAAQ
jgi:hypothetical protein